MTPLAAAALACVFCRPPVPMTIGAGELRYQLDGWGLLTGLQVLYDWNELGPYPGGGIAGVFEPTAALHALLDPTPFTFEWVNRRTVIVFPTGECRLDVGPAAPLPPCRQPLEIHRPPPVWIHRS